MKKHIGIILFLLFFPLIVFAIDEDDIENIEDNNSVTQEIDQGYLYSNDDSGYKVVIEDDANLLSSNQEKDLAEKMKPLTKYGHIIFKSIADNPGYTTSGYASSYYHSLFGSQSGTVFLIDMDLREIYIFSDGANYEVITSNKAYLITDNIYQKATATLYYECALEAYKEMYDLLEGKKIMEPMRYITNALISITLGFFGTFLFMLNKTRIPKVSAKQLLSYSKKDFKMGDIEATKIGTSKRYNPPSSSGGGSGSSGGSGGGGSSGGGGGHSF